MARRERDNDIDHPSEPDLAPFMNLVIILIPMLLLSVVFLEVAVINVTMPIGGSATTDEPEDDDKEDLDLSITVSTDGFRISAEGNIQPPIEGCPGEVGRAPTICLKEDSSASEVEGAFDEARSLMEDDESAGEERLQDGILAFRWRELYNHLSEWKQQYEDETTFRLSADPDIPFALTVRTMDVARYQLEEDSYDDDEEFWKADPIMETVDSDEDGEEIRQPKNLFGDPAFAVHQ